MRVHRRAEVGSISCKTLTENGGGLGFNIQPAAGTVWRIISFSCLYTTDATVGNRKMMWHFYNAMDFMGAFRSPITQAASLQYRYSWLPYYTAQGFQDLTMVMLPWNMDIFVNQEYYIFVDPDGTQAGDHFTEIRVWVEEWIDE